MAVKAAALQAVAANGKAGSTRSSATGSGDADRKVGRSRADGAAVCLQDDV